MKRLAIVLVLSTTVLGAYGLAFAQVSLDFASRDSDTFIYDGSGQLTPRETKTTDLAGPWTGDVSVDAAGSGQALHTSGIQVGESTLDVWGGLEALVDSSDEGGSDRVRAYTEIIIGFAVTEPSIYELNFSLGEAGGSLAVHWGDPADPSWAEYYDAGSYELSGVIVPDRQYILMVHVSAEEQFVGVGTASSTATFDLSVGPEGTVPAVATDWSDVKVMFR